MNAETPTARPARPMGRLLVIVGAVACVAITFVIWRNVSAYQGMWPLPALYFIEVAALSVLSTALLLRGAAVGPAFLWGTAGVLTAFSILGMFSVGLLYLPIWIIFTAASVLSDLGDKRHIPEHLLVWLLAGLVQAVVMLMAVRWIKASG